MMQGLRIAVGQLVCWWQGEHVYGKPYYDHNDGKVHAMCTRCVRIERASLEDWRERFGVPKEGS
jgi:hypothetical protein